MAAGAGGVLGPGPPEAQVEADALDEELAAAEAPKKMTVRAAVCSTADNTPAANSQPVSAISTPETA